METTPLVSIIINNYNYEEFLQEAIDSALNQTYDNVEVIVVDDGSTDGSRTIIESYSDRIIPIFQKNGKQGAAFNNGFKNSTGELILFLDADDMLYSNTVEKVIESWTPEMSKVHFRLQVVNTQGDPTGPCYPPRHQPLASGEVYKELLSKGAYTGVSTSGNVLSRHALEKVMPIPFEYRLTSDDYLSTLIPFYGEVGAVDKPLGAYRIHTSNQWALVDMSGDRFHRFVHHHTQSHQLIREKAESLNYPLSSDLEQRNPGYVWCRLSSLRLNPQKHPISSDSTLKLMYWGIRALWKYSNFNLKKRLVYTLWFIWVGLTPLPLAKMAITWLYVPQKRPKLFNWLKPIVARSSQPPLTAD
ncbi:MAG: glycosyltransferase [Cyanobacteria bacterium P01_A01_bin.116]